LTSALTRHPQGRTAGRSLPGTIPGGKRAANEHFPHFVASDAYEILHFQAFSCDKHHILILPLLAERAVGGRSLNIGPIGTRDAAGRRLIPALDRKHFCPYLVQVESLQARTFHKGRLGWPVMTDHACTMARPVVTHVLTTGTSTASTAVH
jgi:hypothetical protein